MVCLGLGLGLGLRLGLVLALELSARSMLTRRDLHVILPETLETTGWQATGQPHHFEQVHMWAGFAHCVPRLWIQRVRALRATTVSTGHLQPL